jgi:hypothetical protein
VASTTISNVAQNAATNPQAAIAQGQAMITQAESVAQGNLAPMIGLVSGLVADLPTGQITEAVNDLMSIGSEAAAGAAIGSMIFPGLGTVVGAAMGAVMGTISSVISSPPAVPEGEFRSSAEKNCFPGAVLGGSDGYANLAHPACWPDVRAHMPYYQEWGDPNHDDETTGEGTPNLTNFGAGWISPVGNTPAKAEGWAIAQAWMAQNKVLSFFPLAVTGDDSSSMLAKLQNLAAEARQIAIQACEGPANYQAAINLLTSWYGNSPSKMFALALDVGVNNAPQHFSDDHGNLGSAIFAAAQGLSGHSAFLKPSQAYASWAHIVAGNTALDYAYYISDQFVVVEGAPSGFGQSFASTKYSVEALNASLPPYALCAMPDTTLCGLAELAYLVVTGTPVQTSPDNTAALSPIPPKGADVLALHYVTGLSWLWQSGIQDDQATQTSSNPNPYVADSGQLIHNATPTQMHPNFARLIAIISQKINPKLYAQQQVALANANAAKIQASLATVTQSLGLPSPPKVTPVAHVSTQVTKAVAANQLTSQASAASSLATEIGSVLGSGYTYANGKLVAIAPVASGARPAPAPTTPASHAVAYATVAAATGLGLVWWKKQGKRKRKR